MTIRTIPVAARSEAWVGGRSITGVAGWNPAWAMDVRLLWVLCVVRERSLRRARQSSRGALTTVWSLIIDNEGALAHWGETKWWGLTGQRTVITSWNNSKVTIVYCRSQWRRGLRHSYTAARLLRSWVRIPPGYRCLFCVCCVLSGRGLCDKLITHPEESYWLWHVVVCDQETS
jgi:hypothetical protein